MRAEFDSIPGLKGVVQPGGIELILTGPESALKKAEAYLTIIDKSALFKLRQLEEQKNYSDWHSKNYERLRAEYAAQAHRRLYSRTDDGLSTGAGFWYLADDVKGNLSGETELAPYEGAKTPRQYQLECVREMIRYNRAFGVLSTGLGKTLVSQILCNHFVKRGQRVLVIVPTILLMEQTVKALKTDGYSVTGAGGGKVSALGSDVLVSVVNSAEQYASSYSNLIIDECFPYHTLVQTSEGPLSIGQIHRRQEKNLSTQVLSWNETLKVYEYKQVTRSWKKKDRKDLLQIQAGRFKIEVTPEHKFLLSTGEWIPASDLREGDLLTGIQGGSTRASIAGARANGDQWQIMLGSYMGDGNWHRVRPQKYRIRLSHGPEQKAYLEFKSLILGLEINENVNGGFKKDAIYRAGTKTFDVPKTMDTENGPPLNEILRQLDPRGVAIWYLDDGSYNGPSKTITFHTNAFSFSENEQIAQFFQDKYSVTPIVKERRKPDGRVHFCLYFQREEAAKLLKILAPYIDSSMVHKCPDLPTGAYNWDKQAPNSGTVLVDSITSYDYIQKESNGPYGIYDIEVEDNHNFVVCTPSGDGVVAHNCHHAASSMYQNIMTVMANFKRVYALSATPVRADNLIKMVHCFAGPVVYEKDARWAIENGFLAPVKITQMVVETGAKISAGTPSATAYKKLVQSPRVLKIVSEVILKSLEKGKKTLVLFKTVGAGEALAAYMKKFYGVEINVASAKFRPPFFSFVKGESELLVSNSPLLGEGVDVPFIDAVIDVTASSSEGLVRQIIGRGLRPSPGKEHLAYIAILPDGYGQYVSAAKKRLEVYETITDTVRVMKMTGGTHERR